MRIQQRGPRFGALAAFLLTLQAALMTAACPLSAQTRSPALEEGMRLAQQGRLPQALEALSRHKRSFPDDPQGFFVTGIVLREQERWQEAAAEFRQAVDLDPGKRDYRLALAATLGRLSLWQEALQALSPLDGENLPRQSDPAALWLLSDLYFQAEQSEDALRVLDRLDQVEPDSLRSHLRRGQIALLEGRYPEAVSSFRQAIQKAPGEGAVHHGLGLALWRTGQTLEAEEALRKAVQLQPRESSYRLDLGKLLIDSGRPLEAVDVLEAVVEGQDPPAQAYFELARAHRRVDNGEIADRYLQLFRQADQGQERESQSARQASSALRRGQELLQGGQVNQAREAFIETLREEPDNWLAHSYLAKIYLSSSVLPAAQKHLERMREIAPANPEGLFLSATYFYQARDYPQARQTAERAKQLRPDYGDLRNLLGNVYLALGEREKAVEEYQAAVRLEPQRSDFRLNLEAARKNP
ncbi:MAG TPA: tetratricopeptide repeat protein [Acidobacteriota bacterium]|nr:tetratricopeptide repeat protein [Acidobacteriota bacterium]